jgi:alpha-beta hydrolase superfamily lysophospholipase
MRKMRRFAFIGALAALLLIPMGSSPSMAQSRAHVYLLRGLMNIFSLGMDDLAQKIEKRGIYATVHNHSEWQTLADSAAAAYKAGKEGPIILIGHSLGADAVMEMAQYLGRKGIPVALVVPFDGTQSFSTPSNVARLVNITQRDYAYMRKGAGFKGSLYNMDVSSDQSIGHISIDKSPRLHAQVIGYVLAAVGGAHRMAAPPAAHGKPTAVSHHTPDEAKPETPTGSIPPKPAAPGNGASKDAAPDSSIATSGTPVIARPERSASDATAATIVAPSHPATVPPAGGTPKTGHAAVHPPMPD